ncbi:MAG: alpha/beta hydrolase [Clostridia bacterium]|nr:alpha/beta hydrolase [Clostridia bacterium]
MKKRFIPLYIIYLAVIGFAANSYALIARKPETLFVIIPAFLFVNTAAGIVHLKSSKKRLKVCFHGALLLSIFELSVIASAVYHIVLAFYTVPHDWTTLLWSALVCIGFETFLFWNGIICVYATSAQLGIKQRVIGLLCGMIPIANLIALRMIVKTVFHEVRFEADKEALNKKRAHDRICATKYPLVMIHGVFFRDSKYFNYWGRVPAELEANGTVIHYGNHQSAASVADSAAELAERIKAIVDESGCEKVNLIAHSKGGLDCRYALAHMDIAPYVASLTTINTPHRGCLFADYLLTKISPELKTKVATMYNSALRKFGDESPDFLAAVGDLTASACAELGCVTPPEEIFTQSIGSKLNCAAGGKFPLNFSYHLVKYFDGANDGLVSEDSFAWGENYRLITVKGKRGISHGDMIDLNRENIDGFDVREFYVELVSELKNRGL